ncbi:hypothetical protein K450DRAFT_244532 [Umbelopsis ramanniana AG]|uniref:Uncharacterized protein n=1 Tax=Umbelopsis ramanniana AG TaxID=1314678 RepID=A0AAD5E9V3_UMBRA|nr:uncharacterized protein K450DRAFT_244532 [Umbelopsis ramanniana AG]KAI8579005.1 hypothetical protein K450DRAFT_244532 [Umbelopsis ramanniana AG]
MYCLASFLHFCSFSVTISLKLHNRTCTCVFRRTISIVKLKIGYVPNSIHFYFFFFLLSIIS